MLLNLGARKEEEHQVRLLKQDRPVYGVDAQRPLEDRARMANKHFVTVLQDDTLM